ncbi:MAG: hypothetical protein ACRDA3_02830 [Peptostreptococcaceae bacterium]
MYSRKISTVVITLILILFQDIIAFAENNNLVNDVVMIGLKENATLYIGAELEIRAFVNENATIKDIDWIMNKEGIVELDSSGNNATIKAINEGEVSIMARALDESDCSRSINIQVRDYNKENNAVKLPSGILPVEIYGITNKVFQVEANKSLQLNEKIKSIDNYINIISSKGKLKLLNKDEDTYINYIIYEIEVDTLQNIKIEIRVDKKDSGFSELIDNELNNLPETTIMPTKNPNIIHIEGNGEKENPYVVEVNNELMSEQKVETIKELLRLLYEFGTIETIDIIESMKYTSYNMKISKRLQRSQGKNNFYIEIRVDKDDSKSYFRIIEMLNKINKKEANPLPSTYKENSEDNEQTRNENTNNVIRNEVIEGENSMKNIENNTNINLPIEEISSNTNQLNKEILEESKEVKNMAVGVTISYAISGVAVLLISKIR